jgi:hypothetical protein
MKVWYSVQGEMNLAVMTYPREYAAVMAAVRRELQASPAAGQFSLYTGVSLNFNKLVGGGGGGDGVVVVVVVVAAAGVAGPAPALVTLRARCRPACCAPPGEVPDARPASALPPRSAASATFTTRGRRSATT